MSVTLEDIKNFKQRRDRSSLFEALLESDSKIREEAVIALIELEDSRDVESVKHYLMLEPDLHIRGQVLPVLHKTKAYDDQDFLDKFLLKTFELAGAISPSTVSVMSIQESSFSHSIMPDNKKVNFWVWERILGVVLFVASFVSFFLMMVSQSEVRMVYMFGGILLGAIAVGLFILANRKPEKFLDYLALQDVSSENGSSETKKLNFKDLFQHRDVFAMAVLYDGDLPQNKSVTPSMIAREVIYSLHQLNELSDVSLALNTVIKMEGLYQLFSDDDYIPEGELSDMLQSSLEEIREIVDLSDFSFEETVASMMRMKVRTSTLGVIWVGMYIYE
jgi:hypothetical protein